MAQTAIQSIGARAEQIALEHLLQHKLRYLQRNFHCRSGEIDLVMLDDGCLVFVEVRFRTRSSFTTAALSIGAEATKNHSRCKLFHWWQETLRQCHCTFRCCGN